MTGATKIAIGLGVAVAAGIGIAVATSKSAAAAAPAPGGNVPPQGSIVWVRAMRASQGQAVRVSLPADDLALIAQSMTGVTPDLPGFEALLTSFAQALGAMTFQAWAPGAAAGLPDDWPADDTDAEHEFHAQFVYGEIAPPGTLPPLVLSSELFGTTNTPTGLLAWVPKGTGA